MTSCLDGCHSRFGISLSHHNIIVTFSLNHVCRLVFFLLPHPQQDLFLPFSGCIGSVYFYCFALGVRMLLCDVRKTKRLRCCCEGFTPTMPFSRFWVGESQCHGSWEHQVKTRNLCLHFVCAGSKKSRRCLGRDCRYGS